jgi:para-nitrobenzyl esterase
MPRRQLVALSQQPGIWRIRRSTKKAIRSDNYGTLDQQAALKWVQQNIKTFGGDPNNVTVFGESASGIAIMFNLVSPGAAGLFQKVILESWVSVPAQTPLETAENTGSDVAIAIAAPKYRVRPTPRIRGGRASPAYEALVPVVNQIRTY